MVISLFDLGNIVFPVDIRSDFKQKLPHKLRAYFQLELVQMTKQAVSNETDCARSLGEKR